MLRSDDHRRAEFLDSICAAARWRLGDEDAEPVCAFLRQYYARVPLEDVEDRSPEALFAAGLAHWRLGERRPASAAVIRAYNPCLDEHGWRVEHTVVEVVTDDMPFLVDSVTAELNRQELTVHLVVHPVLRVRRDETGRLLSLLESGASPDDGWTESFMHFEVSRQPDEALAPIVSGVRAVLDDVRAAVGDWYLMRGKLDERIEELRSGVLTAPEPHLSETRAFLEFIRENNFTFLGYRAYQFPETPQGRVAVIDESSGLGVLRDPAVRIFDELVQGQPIPAAVHGFLARDEVLTVGKAQRKSTVNRPVLMDVIGVKRFDDGTPAGAHLFVGLFSASIYNRSARNIPLLSGKLARVLQRAGFDPRGHDGRALANIVETFPRDELFQVTEDQLLETALGILHLQQRQRVAVFVRRDDFDRFVSCLVFVPRDRYTTQLRLAIQSVLERAFAGHISAQYLQVGDAPLARLHIVVQATAGRIPDFDVREIEAEIVAAMRTWADHLWDALLQEWGEAEAQRLLRRYGEAFPPGYRDRFNAQQAIADIALTERALADGSMQLSLYRPFAATDMQFRFKVFQPDQPVILSHVLPILEHFGLRVVDEVPHAVRVRADPQRTVMIHDFGLETQSGSAIELGRMAERFHRAFRSVWDGEVESDRLNALVLSADLDVRETTVLRAVTRYLRQAGITFTQAYVERVLTQHPAISGAIARLFFALFDPGATGDPESRAEPLREGIATALDQVASADDDRILRRVLDVVEATLRTNYFQPDAAGRPKPHLALKLDSRRIADLPLPRPMVEVFVYGTQLEAIHLRGGRVARGGLRWSDRREDFRTEVLGLMKAQMVKNAVIVPVGAKGGFVIKRPAEHFDREGWLAQGIACYKSFIGSLLDVTDNLSRDGIIPPPQVVRRDGDDPYLVVAADKGTATFSDIANGIAVERGFWLGDAFASGGSNGYDHKAMGITAKGAWVSVQRHFREIGRDIQSENFTVVGVGDMSGDVFGNGMLLSPHIRLLAAFDHRHIFVDPDPDPQASLVERRRLFELPRSSWLDYDAGLLSPGGRIFDRAAKRLTLTPEIRACFQIAAEQVTPAELISAVLRAEVDLLWFGGIGTFVKASSESHADVGDRANDAVRIDASRLRCRVIGEGANLGITQLGRIEFARLGGRINTDFIDNSAGVDCSDHEVNIKILLDAMIDEGDLTVKQRNQLLLDMTDEVAALVLRDNYLQAQAITLMQADGYAGLDGQARLMRRLERQGRLNRVVEFLPDDEQLTERAAQRQGLTRPELAVLFSYSKIWVKDAIAASDLPDDAHLGADLCRYFPSAIQQRMSAQIARHRLRRELVATTVTNSLINRMGGTFVDDMLEAAGLPVVDIARAYIIARDVFDARALWEGVEALDGTVPAELQAELHREIRRMMERVTLWFLRNGGSPLDVSRNVAAFAEPVQALAREIDRVLPEDTRRRIGERAEPWCAAGVPRPFALRIAQLAVLPSACDIVRIASASGRDIDVVAALYYHAGQRLGFRWLRERAAELRTDGHWQRLAVSALLEELYAHQREVTLHILSLPECCGPPAFDAWAAARQAAVDRSRGLLTELEAAKEVDLAMLAVASRQLRALAES